MGRESDEPGNGSSAWIIPGVVYREWSRKSIFRGNYRTIIAIGDVLCHNFSPPRCC